MVLALPVVVIAPELAGVALLAGLAGGVLPDLDMYVGHRKTLHYPVYYSLAAVAAVVVAAVVWTAATVVVALVALGAAAHSVSDVFGGGLELRPWEATSRRAVYNHHGGRWISPRRWVRYDGAPEDLVLSVALATPLFLVVSGQFRWLVLGAVCVAGVYTAVRRVLPTLAQELVATLPGEFRTYVPPRYR
jgi:hypothetical protein